MYTVGELMKALSKYDSETEIMVLSTYEDELGHEAGYGMRIIEIEEIEDGTLMLKLQDA